MAFVQVGSGHRGRALDHALPLVPFIDFLLCLIAFLLVTAVWTEMARLPADARVPGIAGESPKAPEPELHVRVLDRHFELSWKKGDLVLDHERIPRAPVALADGSLRYPALGDAVAATWRARGRHRAPSDAGQDRAVVHTSNAVEFADVIAVLDAIAATKRLRTAPSARDVQAFAVSFAAD